MRPGMPLLLQLLRGQSIEPTIEEAEWDATLALAKEEYVLPWVAAHLGSQRTSLPRPISERVGRIERDAAIAAFYWSSELQSILQAFDQSGVRVVPLKGPFLANRLYGGGALRTCRDLDILVSKADLAHAESVLTAAGFVSGASEDYQRPWHRRTTTVELHYDVENPLAFNFFVEGALRTAKAASFQGQPCWQLSPEDELLFLCLHAVRHRFECLTLILDLKLAFEKLTSTERAWSPRPEVAGLDSLLTLGWMMARQLRPDLAVDFRIPTSQRQNQHLEKLANRLWNGILTETAEPLDWSRVHDFFLEIELPGWPRFRRRGRHLRILAGRVIESDNEFAARFGLHRGWQVRMLRPVRLLAEYVRR
jgi:hypothetical protein